jgi:hypothetical protein
MLATDYLYIDSRPLNHDTKDFLNKTLLGLLNILVRQGIETKDVDLFGTNDILAFRGTNIVVFCFSRSRHHVQRQFSEINLAEAMSPESGIALDEPGYFQFPGWSEFLASNYFFVRPLSICFPLSYLSLEGEEQKEAYMKVARLMVEAAEEDIDHKQRTVRMNPAFNGRDFLVERDLCVVLMENKPSYVEICEDLIKPTVEGEGFRCLPCGDIFSTGSIIEELWCNLNRAALVIAEVTSGDPGVLYALGICHTVGKEIMMLTQRPDKLPFNFRHMRYYPYKNSKSGLEELALDIKSVLQHVQSV